MQINVKNPHGFFIWISIWIVHVILYKNLRAFCTWISTWIIHEDFHVRPREIHVTYVDMFRFDTWIQKPTWICYVLTPGYKNLRSAAPRLHHRPPGIPRPRIQSVLRPGHKNLRSAPPRLHHRPPRTPRPPRPVPTLGHKNLRSAPPRLHHRPPGIPRPRIQYVLTPGHKNLRSAPPRLHLTIC